MAEDLAAWRRLHPGARPGSPAHGPQSGPLSASGAAGGARDTTQQAAPIPAARSAPPGEAGLVAASPLRADPAGPWSGPGGARPSAVPAAPPLFRDPVDVAGLARAPPPLEQGPGQRVWQGQGGSSRRQRELTDWVAARPGTGLMAPDLAAPMPEDQFLALLRDWGAAHGGPAGLLISAGVWGLMPGGWTGLAASKLLCLLSSPGAQRQTGSSVLGPARPPCMQPLPVRLAVVFSGVHWLGQAREGGRDDARADWPGRRLSTRPGLCPPLGSPPKINM